MVMWTSRVLTTGPILCTMTQSARTAMSTSWQSPMSLVATTVKLKSLCWVSVNTASTAHGEACAIFGSLGLGHLERNWFCSFGPQDHHPSQRDPWKSAMWRRTASNWRGTNPRMMVATPSRMYIGPQWLLPRDSTDSQYSLPCYIPGL